MFFLVECKNEEPKDFIIRQLYYPYRFWEEKVNNKTVVPVFLTYKNGIYTVFKYHFENDYDYSSIKLDSINKYMVMYKDSEKIKKEIFDNIKLIEDNPDIPFPQADTFGRIIQVLDLVDSGTNTAKKIAEYFGFDNRQGTYYIDAAKYLNLINKGKKPGEYKLTEFGFKCLISNFENRNKMLIEEIVKHKPFYETYKYYLENNNLPSKEIIKDYIKNYISKINDETQNRRASTVRGWVSWIIGCQI